MGSFVPQFDTDVFISYSHRDNKAIDDSGWVSEFRTRLENRLGVILGCDASVWSDQRMGPGDVITDEIRTRLRRSAVLVAIISPSYVTSNWCDAELKTFMQMAGKDGITVANKSRAIKVIKLPGEDDHYLQLLPDVNDVLFFNRPPQGTAIELSPKSDAFAEALNKLAASIGEVLKGMRKGRTVSVGPAPSSMADQRDKVLRELHAYGYRVLMPGAGPTERIERDATDSAALNLEFVDSDDRSGPDSPDDRVRRAASQNDAQHLIVVRSASDSDAQLWKNLPAGPEHTGIEVLVNPETTSLKNTVARTLNGSTAAVRRTPDDITRVYLVCHQDDNPLLVSNRARALRDYLRGLDLEVKLPLAEKDEDVDFSADNRTKLKTCDAVILFWGKAGQGWFEQRLLEITKARGWRKTQPFTVTAAYVADPESVIKANFETSEVDMLIKQLAALDTADTRLRSLIEKLAAKPV